MDRGVNVVVTENHGNRAASSGWMMRLVGHSYYLCFVTSSLPDLAPSSMPLGPAE